MAQISIMKDCVFDGPFEENLQVGVNIFTLEDVLHPEVKKLIPDGFDLTKPLSLFYYSCDCQCFCIFSSMKDSSKYANSIAFYADTNEWEDIRIISKDGQKRLTITELLRRMIIFDNDNKIISEKKCQLDSTLRTIDTKWLEYIEFRPIE